jgi:hypothetical protein
MIKPTLEQELKSQIPSLRYEILDDFIGVFDGVYSEEYCQYWIKHFDAVDAKGGTYSRIQTNNDPGHFKKDQTIIFNNSSLYTEDELSIVCDNFHWGFWKVCYPLYSEKYSALKTCDVHNIYGVRLQKTVPTGGYHIWHHENATRPTSHRILVFTLYLNDLENGGETEFLYLKRRIKPKTGRLVIWPAGFTHVHRGNPPLSNDKYILTGWVEL